MKQFLLIATLVTAAILPARAQKGNNQIILAAEMGLPTGHFDNDFNTGFGGTAKFLWGIGRSGQLTFTSGYTHFKAKGEISGFHAAAGILPILAGYRFLKSGFYVEPQLGYGLYRLSVKENSGLTVSETDGAFTYGAGLGFTTKKIDAGVRYQGGKKGSDDITTISLHIGFIFSLKNKK